MAPRWSFQAYQATPGNAARRPTPTSSAARPPREKESAPGPVAEGVRRTPLAVRSKSQARITATGNPAASTTSTAVSTHSGRCAPCMTGSVTWRTAKAKIPYPTIARNTRRRLSSARRSPRPAFRRPATAGSALLVGFVPEASSMRKTAARETAPPLGWSRANASSNADRPSAAELTAARGSPRIAFLRTARTDSESLAGWVRSASSMGRSAARTAEPSRGRLVGAFSSIRPTSSSSPGAPGTSSLGASAGPDDQRPPSSGNGYSADSIRYRMTPSAKTSVRSSSGASAHCSGAM